MHPQDPPAADPTVSAGDLPPQEFHAALHRVADMIHEYVAHAGRYPVVPAMQPGGLRARLPGSPPVDAEPLARLLDDYQTLIEPNSTHWNHPGFMGYFAITASAPGILAEALAAALNNNSMLWRTGPAQTELEEHVCDWLRQMLDLPAVFRGHINDTASIASMLAIAAARHRVAPQVRQTGLSGLPPMTVYASEQAHSSIDKGVLALGLGLDQLRKAPVDEQFRVRPDALARLIAEDRAAGRRPIAIVATAGTTSTTSVDPLRPLAELAERERLWFHVDAAYAGAAAICPEYRRLLDGLERADSIVVNPHKWLFVPFDCSVLLLRDPAAMKEAFSIVPDYLKTSDAGVTNLMDYGVQLGRRFRSLKLWFVIRAFGVRGLQLRIRQQCDLARQFAEWVAADPRFEVVAPVPFSTVCFRLRGDDEAADARNERLLSAVNAVGPVLLSPTRLRGRFVLRLAVGNLHTRREHVQMAWELLQKNA